MGLESLQQTQTPTSFVLCYRSHLPTGAAIILLVMTLLLGAPIMLFGWIVLSIAQGFIAEIIGGILVMASLVPTLGIAAMLLDSAVAAEVCIFDKNLGQIIVKERDGLLSGRSTRYPLSEVTDVEVIENVQLGSQDEVYSIYQIVVNLRSGKQVPITSMSSYYEEIPQQIVASLQDFLHTRNDARLSLQRQRTVARDES
jgi:hypothetical protein